MEYAARGRRRGGRPSLPAPAPPIPVQNQPAGRLEPPSLADQHGRTPDPRLRRPTRERPRHTPPQSPTWRRPSQGRRPNPADRSSPRPEAPLQRRPRRSMDPPPEDPHPPTHLRPPPPPQPPPPQPRPPQKGFGSWADVGSCHREASASQERIRQPPWVSTACLQRLEALRAGAEEPPSYKDGRWAPSSEIGPHTSSAMRLAARRYRRSRPGRRRPAAGSS